VVKSASKSYIAGVVTEAPFQCLLSRLVNPDQEPDKRENLDRNFIRNSREIMCFRPRFFSDPQTLVLDACILNMLTLEVLPDDLLEALHQSTQTLVVEKGIKLLYLTCDKFLTLKIGSFSTSVELAVLQSLYFCLKYVNLKLEWLNSITALT